MALTVQEDGFKGSNNYMVEIRDGQHQLARMQKGVLNHLINTKDWVVIYWSVNNKDIGDVVFKSRNKQKALDAMLEAFGAELPDA